MNLSKNLSLVLMHFIVLIWGLTGILGYEISLGAFELVWWRVLIAFVAIGIFGLLTGRLNKITRMDLGLLIACGAVIGAHWVTFFAAIKVSNISVALCAISTNSFFVALLGPIFGRGPWQRKEFVLSGLVVVGLFFVFHFELDYWLGITLGLISALLSGVFSLSNALFIKRLSAINISFWEMVGAFLSVTIYLLFAGEVDSLTIPNLHDSKCLLVLGLVCTAFALVVSVEVMKKLSPFTCALSINMEPIYTIILALYLYGQSEYMSLGFYLGMACILGTLFLDLWWRRKVVG